MKTANTKKKISEITAVAAMILLLVYLVDAAVGQGEVRFLPMSEKERRFLVS